MLGSQAVRTAVPPRVTLAKYSAKNWPVGHDEPPPPLPIENVNALDTAASLRTATDAWPALAMSLAGMAAVSCVALTNVVGRLSPFHVTMLPATKLLPVAVSVNPGPPGAAEFGESAVRVGLTEPAADQLTCATAKIDAS